MSLLGADIKMLGRPELPYHAGFSCEIPASLADSMLMALEDGPWLFSYQIMRAMTGVFPAETLTWYIKIQNMAGSIEAPVSVAILSDDEFAPDEEFRVDVYYQNLSYDVNQKKNALSN